MLSFQVLLSCLLHPDTFTLLDSVAGPVSHGSYEALLCPVETEASLVMGNQVPWQ